MVDATLVTIHGFWSSPATWLRLTSVWQADDQLAGLRIRGFGYPSPKKPRRPLSGARVPDYDDLAQTFASEYRGELAEVTDLAIVTHSQGGLILQRFLEWMLHEGHGRELARIRSIIMLACPNGGSQYLKAARHLLGFGYHPQAGNLEVLGRRITDTQRYVLARVVNATGVDDHHCRIPVHVYAGAADGIVPAASAQAAFPGAAELAGDHFSILDPDAPGSQTAGTVKRLILADLAAPRPAGPPPAPRSPDPESIPRAKYNVHIETSEGVVIGDGNSVIQSFGWPGPVAGGRLPSQKQGEDDERA